MAKTKKTAFFCQNCGYESAKWMGQCPACREWNTFVEEPTASKTSAGNQGIGSHSAAGRKPVHLTEISTGKEERIPTGIGELDRVLGGGIVPGSLTLVGGDPGIGKSTLLLQVCRMLSAAGHQVLYISGEESLRQIKLRAVRIGEFNENLSLLCETNLDMIRAVMEREKPEIAVIDSIQTMYNEEVGSAPGSVSQVRESTNVLMQIAKGMGISIFIVGHVTKDGNVAGPRVLEHMVDTVLYFEGDRHASYRILRGVKNRFGSTNEIGVFEMQAEGLVEVKHLICAVSFSPHVKSHPEYFPPEPMQFLRFFPPISCKPPAESPVQSQVFWLPAHAALPYLPREPLRLILPHRIQPFFRLSPGLYSSTQRQVQCQDRSPVHSFLFHKRNWCI